jgi:hypothetical protein
MDSRGIPCARARGAWGCPVRASINASSTRLIMSPLCHPGRSGRSAGVCGHSRRHAGQGHGGARRARAGKAGARHCAGALRAGAPGHDAALSPRREGLLFGDSGSANCGGHARAGGAHSRQQGRRLRPGNIPRSLRGSPHRTPQGPTGRRQPAAQQALPAPRRVINLMEALRRSIAQDPKQAIAGAEKGRLLQPVRDALLCLCTRAGTFNARLWPMADYPGRTRTGPVTEVLRSANEWGRRNHTEDWRRHGAHSLPNATQMQ